MLLQIYGFRSCIRFINHENHWKRSDVSVEMQGLQSIDKHIRVSLRLLLVSLYRKIFPSFFKISTPVTKATRSHVWFLLEDQLLSWGNIVFCEYMWRGSALFLFLKDPECTCHSMWKQQHGDKGYSGGSKWFLWHFESRWNPVMPPDVKIYRLWTGGNSDMSSTHHLNRCTSST